MVLRKKEVMNVLNTLKGMTTELTSTSDLLGKLAKGMDKFSDDVDDADKNFKRMTGDLKEVIKMTKESGEFDTKKIDKYGKMMKELQDAEQKLTKTRREKKAGLVDQEELNSAIDRVYDLQASFDELENEINQDKGASRKLLGSMGDGTGSLVDMFGSLGKGPSALMKSAKRANDYGKSLKLAGTAAGRVPGLLGKVGGAAKALGGAIGGISKLFLGWPGLIAMAVVKAVDMYLKIDQFVKDANKAFAAVRGPDIMTDDVQKQFKEFNDQIFNIRKNIQVGLNVKQIREFMESVAQAGVRISRLNEGIHTYREATYVAAKASRTLGLELPRVGNMIGELMNNFRMDMQKIDRVFVQVGFDAQKSGLSTERFWDAVQNANASLAYYGDFIGTASKMTAKFNEASVMSAEQTSETVGELTQAFTNMSRDSAKAFMGLVKNTKGGTDLIKNMFEEADREWGKRADKLRDKLKIEMGKKEKDVEAINTLRNEMAAALEKQTRAHEAATAKNAVAMTPYIGMLSGRASELISHFVKTHSGIEDLKDLEHEDIIKMEKMLDSVGVSKNLLMEMKSISTQMDNKLARHLGIREENKDYEHSFLAKLDEVRSISKEGKKDLKGQFGALNEAVEEGDDKAINKQAAKLSQMLKETGKLDETAAEGIAEIAALSPEMNVLFQDLIMNDEEIDKEMMKEIEKLFDEAAIGTKAFEKSGRLQFIQDKILKKKQEKTYREITKQTLSAKEAMEIAKDGAKWQGAMLLQFDKIGGWVGAIGKAIEAKDPMKEEANELLYSLNINAKDEDELTKNLLAHTEKIEGYRAQIAVVEQKIRDKTEEINQKETGATEQDKTRLEELNEQRATLQKNVEKSEGIVNAVNTLRDIGKNRLKMQKLLVLGKSDMKKRLVRDFIRKEKLLGRGMSAKKLVKKFSEYSMEEVGLGAEEIFGGEIKKQIRELGNIIGGETKGASTGTARIKVGKKLQPAKAEEYNPEGHAGARVETIKKPGIFYGHADELIVKPSYGDFQTVPVKESAESGGPGGGTEGPLNVTVNISRNLFEGVEGPQSVNDALMGALNEWARGLGQSKTAGVAS